MIKKKPDDMKKKQKVIDPSLHPSWQAKKMNSVAIVKPTGTKIVFESNEDQIQERPLKRIKSVKETNSDTTSLFVTKEKNQDISQLHPSWRAKKMQSAGFVKPSGTKIVFD